MRKLLASLSLCLLCLMIPVMASAMTQAEWNQQCRMKTSASVTLYSIDTSGSLNGSFATDTDIPMRESGSLSAGTYVKLYSFDSGLNMQQVGYFSGGSEAYGWARSSSFVPAVGFVQFDDGTSQDVPEALLSDKSALLSYLAKENSGYSFSFVEGSNVIHKEKKKGGGSSSGGSGSGSSGSSGGSGSGSTDETLTPMQMLAKATNRDEAAAALGVEWDDLPKAMVYAPKNLEAALRKTANSKGTVLLKMKHGTIVGILQEDEKWSRVLVGNRTGWVINSALVWVDPEEEPYGYGVISFEGTADGDHIINVRSDGTGKGKKVTKWRTGTEVTIWSVSEDREWYEVESEEEGKRLYVQAAYLTITELYRAGNDEEKNAPPPIDAEADDEEEEEDIG